MSWHTQADKRWTIYEIRAMNTLTGFYFFSRDTLNHFRERVSDWGVWHIGGRVFIHKKRGNKTGEVREFDPVKGSIGTPIKDWEEFRKTL